MRNTFVVLSAFVSLSVVLLAIPSCKSSSKVDNGGADASPAFDAAGGPKPVPTNIDCTKPENCYHLQCYEATECANTPDPGACPIGQVKEIVADGGEGACRACTEADCDGLPSFCCGAEVCKNHVECDMYICKDIEATCMGKTGTTCGFHDLDSDDAWGDCDEAPSDPCCFCKIAVGCADSKCAFGNFVANGNCQACSAQDCGHPTCMGLNGCPTNCQKGFYFDGVRCRDCTMSDQSANIPACKLGM